MVFSLPQDKDRSSWKHVVPHHNAEKAQALEPCSLVFIFHLFFFLTDPRTTANVIFAMTVEQDHNAEDACRKFCSVKDREVTQKNSIFAATSTVPCRSERVNPWAHRGKASKPTWVEESLGRPKDTFHSLKSLPPTSPLVPITPKQLESSTCGLIQRFCEPDGCEGLWIFAPVSVPTSGVPTLLKERSTCSFPPRLFAIAVCREWKVWVESSTRLSIQPWPVPPLDFHVQKGEKELEDPGVPDHSPVEAPDHQVHNGRSNSHPCLYSFPLPRVHNPFYRYHKEFL